MEKSPIDRSNYEETDKLLMDLIYNPIKASTLEFTKDQQEMLIIVHGMPEFNETLNSHIFKDCTNEIPLFMIILKRLILYDFTMTNKAILLLAFIAESPGNAMLLLHYLQIVCKNQELKIINSFDLGMKIFPAGFPTDQTMKTIWYDNCKVEYKRLDNTISSGNLVDIVSPYKSDKR